MFQFLCSSHTLLYSIVTDQGGFNIKKYSTYIFSLSYIFIITLVISGQISQRSHSHIMHISSTHQELGSFW